MENSRWPELSVLQAAHAAELLIKARIAEEHPLLIFDQLPKSTRANNTQLDIDDLFIYGKTIQWSDLPERLWAVTGKPIPNIDKFEEFGRLRNGIQHFSPVPWKYGDPRDKTLRFVFDVIDPFINECWGLYAIDYDEDYDPYIYFVPVLVHREILFLVSERAADCYKEWDIDWSNVSVTYKDIIQARVKKAIDGEE